MSRRIPLSRGLFAIVDDEDYEAISRWKWSASPQGKLRRRYRAVRVEVVNGRQQCVLMHRAITEAPEGTVVDHINGDPLDNRRANLRVCSQRQNAQNGSAHADAGTSRFKGVSWDKRARRWRASHRGRYLGLFAHERAAAAAYDAAASSYAGEFARLNLSGEAACQK